MTQAWHERSQYGTIIRNLIKDLNKHYNLSKKPEQKLKLSHSIAYLIQCQNSLIKGESNLEKRLKAIEDKMT